MAENTTKTTIKKEHITKTESNWQLLLWNDDVNDMTDVAKALHDICGLDQDKAVAVMLEAHNSGQAFVKSGTHKALEIEQKSLNKKAINASVVKDEWMAN